MRRPAAVSLVLALVGLAVGCADDEPRAVSPERAEQCMDALGLSLDRAEPEQLHGLLEGATAALGDGRSADDDFFGGFGGRTGPVIVFAPDDETADAIADRLGDREEPPTVADDVLYRIGNIVVYLGTDGSEELRQMLDECL